ncbi:NAD(P)/FAD-dependent oxidoreductase [Luteibacter sp. 3190]|uniref:FAD-dependent oxidoreductase n=1 Tax=Luteibacter sp. 3190 TaxID=2817736 RepID=UPI00285CBD2B|nr:NAD(P)/FAD-dependent oxidoreductase [Luteibacter sp. 3190]MDR6935775.1 2-polyprenyl-6-methoxyphenol hydroxylase-like FAD-dependent oxidoreductase [Luteibacter sp. 3190]
MAQPSQPILIAGGGIAGLATWRALKRRGIASRVVERSARATDGGLAINLPGNAIAALDRLGLAGDIERLGHPVRKREYRTSDDRLLAAIDEDAFWGEAMRPRAVRRADLMAMLASGLEPSDLHLGAIAGVRQDASTVHVALADGAEVSAPLLVGADGVRSTVRQAVTGAASATAARLASESWRFMAPNPGVDGWTVWTGKHGLILLLPVDDHTVYGWVSLGTAGNGEPQLDRLAAAFSGFPARVRKALGWALANPENIYHSPIEEVRAARWSQGRVLLIGDAAHATAPVWAEGAALGMEDALVLAGIVAECDDPGAIGPRFEQARQPRVAHVQAMTDKLSKAARLPHALRTILMPFITPKSYRGTYEPLKTL